MAKMNVWMHAGKLKFMRKFTLSLIVTSAAPAVRFMRSAAFLAAIAAAPISADISSAQQIGSPPVPIPDASSRSGLNHRDDDPMADQANEKRIKELNVMRQKQITSDAAKLLLLATELKSNLDKGGEEASSLDMMHKAEQIEKLARSVRTRMTDAIGGERLTP